MSTPSKSQSKSPKKDPDYLTPEREALAAKLAAKAEPIRVNVAGAL